jgi:hypothetical protein
VDQHVGVAREPFDAVARGSVAADRHHTLVALDPVANGRFDRSVLDECALDAPWVTPRPQSTSSHSDAATSATPEPARSGSTLGVPVPRVTT